MILGKCKFPNSFVFIFSNICWNCLYEAIPMCTLANTIDERRSKSLETQFSIAMCRQTWAKGNRKHCFYRFLAAFLDSYERFQLPLIRCGDRFSIRNVYFEQLLFLFQSMSLRLSSTQCVFQGNKILKRCSIIGKLLYILGYNNFQI